MREIEWLACLEEKKMNNDKSKYNVWRYNLVDVLYFVDD
jgi:hypothetical protein